LGKLLSYTKTPLCSSHFLAKVQVIISQIGKGTFGVVYKARDVGLRRLVAIKELVAHSPGLESTDGPPQPAAAARLF
jgi:hypothetical protein